MHSAIILAGGLGTRLQKTVPHLPKALAPIRGTPFLKILVEQLEKTGLFSEIVLALGHKAEAIQEAFSHHPNFRFSIEETLLGTGGALLHALPLATQKTVCVLNGDSLSSLSFADFLHFHREEKRPVSIACKKLEDVSRFGTVVFDEGNRVVSFSEKKALFAAGWVSIGIYAFEKEALENFPQGPSSLERDIFPELLAQGISAYPYEGPFLDIGTQESYLQAQETIPL